MVNPDTEKIVISHCAEVKKVSETLIFESPRVKVSFEPLIVGPEDGMGIKGFIYIQRRASESEEWPKKIDFQRSSIPGGKFVKYELHSDELEKLYHFITGLKQFAGKADEDIEGQYYKVGCSRDKIKEFVANNQLYKLSHPDEYKLIVSLLSGDSDYIKAITNLISKVSDDQKKLYLTNQMINVIIDSDPIIINSVLSSLDRNKEKILQNRITIQSLTDLQRMIKKYMEENRVEEDWYQLFKEYKWILPYILPGSRIYLANKANVGNVKMDGDSSEEDFILKNEYTDNITLVEIKKPSTNLIGGKYRDYIYAIDEQLSGAITQVLNYKLWITENHPDLKNGSKYASLNPTCVIIAGKFDGLDNNQKQSFDLYRQSLSGIMILTYDEVIGRINDLIDFLGV